MKQLPEDFREFLNFLNEKQVEYSGRLKDLADLESLGEDTKPVE
jgi:hypothetical protein